MTSQPPPSLCRCRDARDSCEHCPDDRLDLILRRGAPAILRVAAVARRLYEEGTVCECPEPILTGYDLMCSRCLRENVGQRDRAEARIRGPHEFVPLGDGPTKSRFCKICVRPERDPRHA